MGEGRGDICCRSCGALLGRINRGDRHAPRGIVTRIVTVESGVWLFLDLAMARVELHCPACGACGRTFDREKLRGVVQKREVA